MACRIPLTAVDPYVHVIQFHTVALRLAFVRLHARQSLYAI